MDTICWGIIGCGNVTETKSGPAFGKASGSRLVAVMRRTASLAEDYARRHGVPRWYSNADALIADPEVDAVYVATPPGSHLEYAARVAAAGKPCYVEKPMARSYAECRRMLDAFTRAGRPLFIAYYRRMLPRFLKAKELIDTGRLGRVTGCRYRLTQALAPPAQPLPWRLDPEQSGGGLFLDIGSHVLDVLDYLLGEFVEYGGTAAALDSSADAQPSRSLVEDCIGLHFRTARGVVGSASWNFAASIDEERLEIDGTEGRLAMQVLAHSPLTLAARGGAAPETFTLPDPAPIQQPLIQTVVDELLGRSRCPSTGESAARTSKVMDAALSGFYGGRDDGFWLRPRPSRPERG